MRSAVVPLALGALGCSGLLPEPTRVVATDGTAEIVVPWSFREIELNDAAVIERGNQVGELYVVVLTDAQADLASTLDAYAETSCARHRDTLTDVRAAGPTPRTIGGRPAIEHVLHGGSDGTPVAMLHTVVDGEWSRFQVLAWTLEKNWTRREDDLRRVVDSLVERRPPAAAPASAPGAVRSFASDDGAVAIDAPREWVPAEGLSELAGIELKHPTRNAWLIVVSEPSAEVAWTLEEYGRYTREALLSSWTDARQTPPEDLELRGRPAIRSELRGIRDGVRIVGAHVVVRDGAFVHQVYGWTVPSEWEALRDDLDRAAASVREKR